MRFGFVAGIPDSLIRFRKKLISDIREKGHEVFAFAPQGDKEISEELRNMGVVFHPVALSRTGMNPFADMALFFRLRRLFLVYRLDAVFCYTVKPIIYGILAAVSVGVSRRYSMVTGLGYAFKRDTPGNRVLNSMVRPLYRAAMEGSQVVFFQNPDNLSVFLSEGLLKDSGKAVLVNGSGVDLEEFPPALPVTSPISFLLVARLLRDKGILQYVAAARRIKKSYPGVSFRLLGPFDANPESIRRELVEGWERAGWIEYLGATRDVRPYLSECSVFVLPSFHEGTPRSVLEAMAMSKPIVTTDVPGCRETVKDGENGFLVQAGDSDSLADAMERFIRNPGLIPLMGEKSRAMATDKYDVSKVNAVMLEAMGLVGND